MRANASRSVFRSTGLEMNWWVSPQTPRDFRLIPNPGEDEP